MEFGVRVASAHCGVGGGLVPAPPPAPPVGYTLYPYTPTPPRACRLLQSGNVRVYRGVRRLRPTRVDGPPLDDPRAQGLQHKCVWEPTHRLTHLGLGLDFERRTFEVCPKKLGKIEQGARELLRRASSVPTCSI